MLLSRPSDYGPSLMDPLHADVDKGEERAAGATFQATLAAAEAHATQTEQGRTLAPRVVEACEEERLFTALVPKAYGGWELDPLSYVRIVEEVSAADAATGWCLNIAATTGCLSWYFPPATAKTVWGSPRATGGAYAPSGKGSPDGSGWRVSGQWAWGSGSPHCAWLTGGFLDDTGVGRIGLFRSHDVRLLDTWQSAGLRGTASTDWEVRDVMVDEGYWIPAAALRPTVDAPLARMPMFTTMALGVASVPLGIAVRAVRELESLAGAKTPLLASRKLAEHVPAQLALSEATARIRSARSYLQSEVAAIWDDVVRGDKPSVDRRAAARLAAYHAANEAARAVDLCFHAGGGSAVYESSPLQRCFRDVHTALAHILVSDRNAVSYARVALGLPIDASML